MSRPFLKIGEINDPKRDFTGTIDYLRDTLKNLKGFELGGIHRWSSHAFTFEFHLKELSRVVMETRWENVYALPMLKVGVYEEDGAVHINTRYPYYFLESIAEDVTGEQALKVDNIFSRFKKTVIDFFKTASSELGGFELIHRLDGFDMDEKKMEYLGRLKKTKDIYRKRIKSDTHEEVVELAHLVTSSFDELEGWKIIDVRDYSFVKGTENLILIEFCTPKYAGMAMEMNKKYNLILPCLGSVRSEKGYAFINMFLPTFMFKPLFYSVDPKVRREYKDFPEIVTGIIKDTCLKKVR